MIVTPLRALVERLSWAIGESELNTIEAKQELMLSIINMHGDHIDMLSDLQSSPVNVPCTRMCLAGKYAAMFKKTVLASAIGLTLGLSASGAWAGPKLVPLFGTSFRVNGLVGDSSNQNRDPFEVQVFSAGNECLRIAGVTQDADMEATLVSPTGRMWQDDDGNGLNRPLIKAITDVRGWYTFQVSHFSTGVVNADFSVDLLRTTSTSSLCNPPTGPRVFVAPAEAPAKSGQQAPKTMGGANG